MKTALYSIVLLATITLISACSSEPVADIDILNSLPQKDYTTILWFSPNDYLNSNFVTNFKNNAALVMPLISQQLGFDPERIAERYGFPRKDCDYVAVFIENQNEMAVLTSKLTDLQISKNMNELLGYELVEEKFEGYTCFVDPDVSQGYFRQEDTVVVAAYNDLKNLITTGIASHEGFRHECLSSISSHKDSIGFHSQKLAQLDTANFASQLAKIEEDQALVNEITGATERMHSFSGSLSLSDKVAGTITMYCDSPQDAELLQDYFDNKLPAIKDKFAERAEQQGRKVAMFITVTKESVIDLLDSFGLKNIDNQLIISIDLPWSRFAPFFSGTKGQ